MKAVGNKVVLKKLEKTNGEYKISDGIFIPGDMNRGFNLSKAEVISIGKKAQEKSNLNVGDIVEFDTAAVFKNEPEIVLINVENIIFKL